MTSHRPRTRYCLLLLFLLLSPACRDGELVAAPSGGPLPDRTAAEPAPAVTAKRIVGGGGVRLAVYEGGNAGGPAVVLIHGFTGTYLTWERQLAGPLAAEFRLVTYDLRGHGASDKPLEAAPYTDGALWADDLDAVIRTAHLDRPVLVGWSYGGYVIADYLRRYGDTAIGGVVFLGAVTKQGTAEAAGYLSDDARAVFGDVLAADVRRNVEGTRALTRLFANPLRGPAWERAYGSAMMVPPEVRAAMWARVLDNDDVLARVRVPTLVVHGAADRVVRVSAAAHIAKTVPGAKLLVYDGVGHAVQLDAPQRLGRDLAEFVRAIRGHRQP